MSALVSVAAAVSLLGPAPMPTQLPARGRVTYYADGVMEQVAAYRYGHGIKPCPDCVGLAAMLRPADLGRQIWIQVDGRAVGPLLVVDCADPDDLPDLLEANLVAELDYNTAQRLGLRGPVTATVLADWPRVQPRRRAEIE